MYVKLELPDVLLMFSVTGELTGSPMTDAVFSVPALEPMSRSLCLRIKTCAELPESLLIKFLLGSPVVKVSVQVFAVALAPPPQVKVLMRTSVDLCCASTIVVKNLLMPKFSGCFSQPSPSALSWWRRLVREAEEPLDSSPLDPSLLSWDSWHKTPQQASRTSSRAGLHYPQFTDTRRRSFTCQHLRGVETLKEGTNRQIR